MESTVAQTAVVAVRGSNFEKAADHTGGGPRYRLEAWEYTLLSVAETLKRHKGKERIRNLEAYLVAIFQHRLSRAIVREKNFAGTVECLPSSRDLAELSKRGPALKVRGSSCRAWQKAADLERQRYPPPAFRQRRLSVNLQVLPGD